jgi:HMG-box domain
MNNKNSTSKQPGKDIKKEKAKRGCSGYYFFIQDHLAKLRLAQTPYTGSNASEDFLTEWEDLTPAEREKYNSRSTSK